MIFVTYNVLVTTLTLLFSPFFCILVMAKKKYRGHILKRLGKGLRASCRNFDSKQKTIWIHALSVGEVTSAIPLLTALRNSYPNINIVFSAATRSGLQIAEKMGHSLCNTVIAFPLDLFIITHLYLKTVAPDLFILVETDFWPSIISGLKHRNIPMILVNGRISEQSLRKYARYPFLFTPMFQQFAHLCVQTERDKNRFKQLGVPEKKIEKLGNLKYATVAQGKDILSSLSFSVKTPFLCVAGSTHPGEELLLFTALAHGTLATQLSLIIAPRNIDRAEEIAVLARKYHLSAQCHSRHEPFSSNIYILDTLGELSSFYSFADFCFVGGSMVDEGGHNPLEPAAHGKPILFGKYMQDFEEISEDLLGCGAAHCVESSDELVRIFLHFINNPHIIKQEGAKAQDYIVQQKGLIKKHLELLGNYL